MEKGVGILPLYLQNSSMRRWEIGPFTFVNTSVKTGKLIKNTYDIFSLSKMSSPQRSKIRILDIGRLILNHDRYFASSS